MNPLAALAAALCLLADASALASPSPPSGYHHGAPAAAARRAAASPRRTGRARPTSYVPDGLTEEQYRRIKEDELATQRGMNFGAWGPRFAEADGDPDGNWFNLPSLWTGGFDARRGAARRPAGQGAGTEAGAGGLVPALAGRVRRYGPAYSMLLVAAELLGRSISARRALSSRWIAARVVLSFAALKPMSAFASFAERRKLKWLRRNGTTKVASLTALLMMSLAFALR